MFIHIPGNLIVAKNIEYIVELSKSTFVYSKHTIAGYLFTLPFINPYFDFFISSPPLSLSFANSFAIVSDYSIHFMMYWESIGI